MQAIDGIPLPQHRRPAGQDHGNSSEISERRQRSTEHEQRTATTGRFLHDETLEPVPGAHHFPHSGGRELARQRHHQQTRRRSGPAEHSENRVLQRCNFAHDSFAAAVRDDGGDDDKLVRKASGISF